MNKLAGSSDKEDREKEKSPTLAQRKGINLFRRNSGEIKIVEGGQVFGDPSLTPPSPRSPKSKKSILSRGSQDFKEAIPDANGVYDVTNIKELPKDVQKALKSAKLPKTFEPDEWDILLNIIHFQYKLKFKAVENKKRQIEEEMRQRKHSVSSPKTPKRPFSDDSMLKEKAHPRNIFRLLNEEGKGGFGIVWKAVKYTAETEKFGIKVMKHTDPRDMRYNHLEISVLEFCQHPNIVSYFGSYLCDDNIWLVMEFLEGGTVEQATRVLNFSEAHIAYVCTQVLKGLEYLHGENLVHRDLKSANIMLSTTAQIKIIDFGLCVDISDGKKTSMVGSPFWMPPEMIRRQPHDHKVDIWCLGVSMTELANGHAPNNKSALKAMYTVGTVGIPNPLEKPKLWTDNFAGFLAQCLQVEAKDRPSAAELLEVRFKLNSS
eukprot:TRINITY_DN6787_c0_g1_i2.p1 TRINITY_DN6787_c0_g1~~TRINITY_DN6787_c0_g1_i2.p1  ORF type:complete len:494 (-),score=106.14 TRINITY_DN6787_c0_g1_i2:164-1456(-)